MVLAGLRRVLGTTLWPIRRYGDWNNHSPLSQKNESESNQYSTNSCKIMMFVESWNSPMTTSSDRGTSQIGLSSASERPNSPVQQSPIRCAPRVATPRTANVSAAWGQVTLHLLGTNGYLFHTCSTYLFYAHVVYDMSYMSWNVLRF